MSGMAAMQEYREKVQVRFTPVVMVQTTPDVDASCADSGLSLGKEPALPSLHPPRPPPPTTQCCLSSTLLLVKPVQVDTSFTPR